MAAAVCRPAAAAIPQHIEQAIVLIRGACTLPGASLDIKPSGDGRLDLRFAMPNGVRRLVQLANRDVELYQESERQKDDLFKSRYFSPTKISDKRDEVLNTMDNLQVDLETTTAALGTYFRYSVAIWNSGNFYTIVSSNARQAILDFVSLLIEPAIPPAYCHHSLPAVLNDTEAQPLATALKWRSSHPMTEALPRLLTS
jgi:hypothetical protein